MRKIVTLLLPLALLAAGAIAGAAGLSNSALYAYFTSKAELLVGALRAAYRDLLARSAATACRTRSFGPLCSVIRV